MIRYLSVEQVLSLHQGVVGYLRADPGIRDIRALDAAVARPWLTFEGEDLYPTLEAKASALMLGLLSSGPFADAASETAWLAAEVFLNANGAKVQAEERDIERVVAAAAGGEITQESLSIWFRQRTVTSPS